MLAWVAATIVLAGFGLGLFVYGDLIGSPATRTIGIGVTSVAVVLTALLAAGYHSQRNR